MIDQLGVWGYRPKVMVGDAGHALLVAASRPDMTAE